MKTLSGKGFCQLLEQNGWVLARVNGSHRIYIKEGSIARLSVPVHGNTDLKTGLQRALMRAAGISEEDL